MVFLLLLGFVAAPPAGAAHESTSAQLRLTRHDRLVLEEMNRVRAAHGLAPLRIDANLQTAARAHSQDMASRGYFAHGDFAGRMERFGVQAPRAAENIAWASGGDRVRRVVRMWLGSPPHRANLLRGGFRHVGVATVLGTIYGRRDAMVVTTDFAGT